MEGQPKVMGHQKGRVKDFRLSLAWHLCARAHAILLGRSPSLTLLPSPHPTQCRAVAHEFLGCIESNKRDYSACKDLSKAYLQCRMDKVCYVGGKGVVQADVCMCVSISNSDCLTCIDRRTHASFSFHSFSHFPQHRI